MSIKIKSLLKKHVGIPLAPPKAVAKKVALKAPPKPVKLKFNMQSQVQTQWCWAATSTSVSIFYKPKSTWTQCLVAGKAWGSNCCKAPTPCNKPWYLDKALTITGNFMSISGVMTFTTVRAQLVAGRVIGTRIGWSGGGGHFMVIYGCQVKSGVNYLNIDDPIYGKSDITETTFKTRYQGSGSWTHSYKTKP